MLKKIIKFSTLVVLLLILIGLVLIIFVGHGVYSGKGATLTFRNESGFTIKTATITLSGYTCGVKKLEDTGEISYYFGNLSDSSYSVQVELVNGSIFQDEVGYVCGGMNFRDIITINKAGEIILWEKGDGLIKND